MKRILFYSGIILAFFLIGVVVANFIIMPLLVRRGEEVVVPNVCDLPIEDAITKLNEAGLEGVVVERRYDRIIEEGGVIVQEPLPETHVKRGRIINLSVSLGPEVVKVPLLSGVDFNKGSLIINRLGLVIEKVDSVFSDSVEEGKIITTIPDFETELQRGDAIRLIISKGVVLKIPDLVGMQLGEAQKVLKKMGLICGKIEEVSGSGKKGTIIIQSPEPGKVVNTGDTVNLMLIK